MNKIYSTIITLAIMSGVLFPVKLSAYTIDGSTVTLTAADRTSDNTSLIQGFLDNAAYTKIIIQPGTNNVSWLVCPLFFDHDNSEIHLNANTVLEAKPGGYPNGGDCVLRATSLNNIKVTGDAGAKIFMQKAEYAAMAAAEHRHTLSFVSCSDVTISGLTLADTGGDGIYLGVSSTDSINYCSNIIVDNVTVDNASRNGLSVISVDGLTITDCIFKNTKSEGNIATAGPGAGIDIEPNNSSERLKNIVITDCLFQKNASRGLWIYNRSNNGSTDILDIKTKNCTMQGNQYGISVSWITASLSSSSEIVFENCTIIDNKNIGVGVSGKSLDGGMVIFNNCYLKNNCLAAGVQDFLIYSYTSTTEIGGNIQLNNVVIEQTKNRTVPHYLEINGSHYAIENVSGTVYASSGQLAIHNATNINIATDTNTPQSYWKLDETAGNIATDSNGNCDGTLLNSPIWGIGRIGGGLTLDGIDQFLEVTDDASLDIGTDDFSISLWMQRSSGGASSRLIYKGAGSASDPGYALVGSDTRLYMQLANGITRKSVSCSIPSLDQWHHVVYTIDRTSGEAKLYMNGVYQTKMDISNFTGDNISNSRNLLIGAINSSGALAWPGKIDELRIYKRTLTESEVLKLYVATP